jgi:hypothetical protein
LVVVPQAQGFTAIDLAVATDHIQGMSLTAHRLASTRSPRGGGRLGLCRITTACPLRRAG